MDTTNMPLPLPPLNAATQRLRDSIAWLRDGQPHKHGIGVADMVVIEAALRNREELWEALQDMLSGWKYIRSTHGDLYGVGWDRAENKAEAALERVLSKSDAAQATQAVSEPVATQPAEAVAWRYQDARGNFRYRSYKPGFDREYSILKPVPLYTHPAPASASEPSKQAVEKAVLSLRDAARRTNEISAMVQYNAAALALEMSASASEPAMDISGVRAAGIYLPPAVDPMPASASVAGAGEVRYDLSELVRYTPTGRNLMTTADDGPWVRFEAVRAALARQAPAPLSQGVPEGWKIERADDIEPGCLRIVSPKDGPGFVTLAANHASHPYRMLHALASALLSHHPQPQAVTEDARDGERESDRQLMKFYSVETIPALIDAQERHIAKLQAKLPPLRDESPRSPRIA